MLWRYWMRSSIKRAESPIRTIGQSAFLLLVGVCLSQQLAIAQDPWSGAATRMADAFTGPIVRGFSLVAIVVGGLTLAFSDGGGKRTLGGLIFGLGMALGATQFMSWLFQ